MALAIRYCYGKCITEKFISFIECENLVEKVELTLLWIH